MFVLKKNPYGLNTRMVQLVLDRMSILIWSDRTRTVGPYAYGRTGPDRKRTVQIRVWSGTYIYIYPTFWQLESATIFGFKTVDSRL